MSVCVCMCVCTKVFWNGERLPIKSFSEYVDLYLGPKEAGVPRVYEKLNDRWEVCISPTDGNAQQVRKKTQPHMPWHAPSSRPKR